MGIQCNCVGCEELLRGSVRLFLSSMQEPDFIAPSFRSPKYVSLKILNKSATEEADQISANEVAIIARARVGMEPEHRPQLPLYTDRGLTGPPHEGWFRISGFHGVFTRENGQHLVIISPPYGEHMRDYMLGERNKRLPPPLVKRVARQVLTSLDYLHSLCGIIHCGAYLSAIISTYARPTFFRCQTREHFSRLQSRTRRG